MSNQTVTIVIELGPQVVALIKEFLVSCIFVMLMISMMVHFVSPKK